MKRATLIASALAAVLAAPAATGVARAESGYDQAIDEKCYGVSAADISVCGTDANTCAFELNAQGKPTYANRPKAAVSNPRDEWAYVPKGTCVKIYGGSLSPKVSS